MKKLLTFLSLILCITNLNHAQTPCAIDSELQQLMLQKSDELISVNIIFKSQIDVNKLNSRGQAFLDKESKRKAVLKEFKNFSEKNQSEVLSILQAETRSNRVQDVTCHWITNMINCKVSSDVILQLAQHPDIEAITYNKLEYMLFDEEIQEVQPSRGLTSNVTTVNADDLWNKGFTGKGILVSVMDTGVNTNHIDLKDHLWDGGAAYPNHGYNSLDKNNDVTDTHGHGTHCAGTVCGDGTSGTQHGVAPDATLMCVKVLGADGKGSVEAIVDGVEFSVENGADVLSLSLGLSFPDSYSSITLRRAFENLLMFDVVASVAAGNDRDKINEYIIPRNINAPGNCPPPWIHPDQKANSGALTSVVCVGAVDSNDKVAYFSSEGPTTWAGTEWNDYKLDMATDLEPGWLNYDDGTYASNISAGATFSWGVMFPPEKLKDFENGKLTTVSMFDCLEHSGEIEIYQGGETPSKGTLKHKQTYSCTGSYKFVEVELSKSLTIDNTKNLWVILTSNYGEYGPAAACRVLSDPNGRWFGTKIGFVTKWQDICEHGLNYTWMIRAFVTNYNGKVATLGAEENTDFGLIRPDVCAPGVGIVSCSHTSNTGQALMSGTSMATPCVTGVMALLLEENPDLTPAQICEALEMSAKKLTDKKSNLTGSGRIDALAASTYIGQALTTIALKEVAVTEIKANEEITLPVTLSNLGTASSHDITLELSSDDPYVSIVKDIANFGFIYPKKEATNDFVVKASASTPDGHEINFTLTDVSENADETPWTATFSVKVSNPKDEISELNSAFTIFPNPVEKQLVIETDIKVEEVEIYDVFGRLQDYKTTGQQGMTSIDVSEFNAGVYFIKIKTDKGEVTKRFIKK